MATVKQATAYLAKDLLLLFAGTELLTTYIKTAL